MSEPLATPDLKGCALVIGISNYQRITKLPPVQDAEDIAAVLRDPNACGYAGDRVELCTEAAATRAGILSALDTLLARAERGASAFIYFSGHGGRVSEGPLADCYLMPVEASWRSSEDIASSAISGRELSERLRRIQSQRVTVVLDCCRAAGIAEPKDASAVPESLSGLSAEAVASLAKGRGRAVLAASRADGFAYSFAGRRNSLFTQHLLEALRGGALGTGGVIRVCDLFDYVQRHVAAELPEQRPVFKAELEENYPLALFRGGVAPPFTLRAASDGFSYDAFISYRRPSPERDWVERVFVPKLEGLGLRLCLAHRDFRLGAPRIREMGRAVERSRRTLAVLTPAYLEGAFEEYQALLAQHQGLEQNAARFIPLLREACSLPLGVRMLEALDVSDPALEQANLARLAQLLREPLTATDE